MGEDQGGRSTRVRYLTVVEVADLMRVSRMTVYRLVHAGELPAVRVGRSFRVPQDALDAYLRSSATVEPEGLGEERRSS
ncbi:helix-turn-helix domain-containing protein [Cellulomonas sp. zg-ZUI222]|uniref:Helix-turn-helix domain-containing protein n=1 Tax=Cellulomonas wangleii TaxID=2816956 RepID=A0ABX8D248_9CELL|nr:helix-turn-helix domain-containing protein [Cellulomonas wangleii]MBO0920405.1 helix-turn-helix domain-containing protein [Cellulomonas wangleii]MBO0923177.1 helix-turn-helix domain-containing protein [Cellulomonas wangleii]QVI61551.1 helix-turn-helix domain-containing protein [Cellulomonas wangleii]